MSWQSSRRQSALRRHGEALLLYIFLSVFLTWPLVTRVTTHVTGDGIDDPALAWNLWWVKTRLVDQITPDIFHSGWMFHPIDINLAFYTLTPLNGLLSVPLQSAIDLVVANNLLLLSSFVLGGYGFYLLAVDLLIQARPASARQIAHWAALSAGVVYAFAAPKLFYASLGQFNIASSQWIPFVALYVLRTGRSVQQKTGLRAAGLAALFLVFQAWAELTYASFLLLFIALYFLWRLAIIGPPPAHTRMQDAVQQVVRFAFMGVIFVAGIAPFLMAMAPDLRREGDFFASGGGFADTFSADLMGYLLPTRLHPLMGGWVAGLPFPNDKGQQIFLGYVVAAVALLGAINLVRALSGRPRRAALFWVVAAIFFGLLSLGPQLRWAGQELPIPGPFGVISRLPFFSGNRYPSRYSVMVLLCVAALFAWGFCWLLTRRWVRARPGVGPLLAVTLTGLVVLEHLSIPLPLNDFRVPPIYAQLADPFDEAALLELPTGWRNGARVMGKSDTLIMMQQWWQTEHGLRRIGGNTSRNPAYKFDYFTAAPIIGDLIALMNSDGGNPATQHIAAEVERQLPEMIARGRAQAPDLLDFLGVTHVTVHVNHAPPSLLRYVDEALPVTLADEWQGVDWQGRPATIRLYRVTVRGNGAWAVDLAGEQGNLHLAEGWAALPPGAGQIRYALRPEVDLLLDLPDQGGRLSLEVAGPALAVAATVNGHAVGEASLAESGDDRQTVALDIPPGVGDEVVDRLTLRFIGDPALSASRYAPPTADGWPIGASNAALEGDVSLVVRSAGEEVGDFARIFVNGVDAARNRRGYNLAALTPSGEQLDSVVFDTLASADEALAMATWLDSWPPNTIVAGAVADEASLNLTQQAVDALRRMGVQGDLRGRFRWSHAFVAVVPDQGVPPAPALEAMSLLRPADVAVGAPVDGPLVYGGVGRVEFSPR